MSFSWSSLLSSSLAITLIRSADLRAAWRGVRPSGVDGKGSNPGGGPFFDGGLAVVAWAADTGFRAVSPTVGIASSFKDELPFC